MNMYRSAAKRGSIPATLRLFAFERAMLEVARRRLVGDWRAVATVWAGVAVVGRPWLGDVDTVAVEQERQTDRLFKWVFATRHEHGATPAICCWALLPVSRYLLLKGSIDLCPKSRLVASQQDQCSKGRSSCLSRLLLSGGTNGDVMACVGASDARYLCNSPRTLLAAGGMEDQLTNGEISSAPQITRAFAAIAVASSSCASLMRQRWGREL